MVDLEKVRYPRSDTHYTDTQTQNEQAGVELRLTQAETVSLELDLIRVGLENIIWSQNIFFHKKFFCEILFGNKFFG